MTTITISPTGWNDNEVIQAAADALKDGGIVKLEAGEYHECAQIGECVENPITESLKHPGKWFHD
jgi:hypothetical protein